MDKVLLLPGPYIKDGFIKVHDRPGLGIELNPDVVRAHLAPGETVAAPTLMTATPPTSFASRFCSFSRSQSEVVSSTRARSCLTRPPMAADVPAPSTIVVLSLWDQGSGARRSARHAQDPPARRDGSRPRFERVEAGRGDRS
jgi:hypothetical protein